MSPLETEPGAAVLVAVQLPGVDDAEHAADLVELRRLVRTLGHDVVATITQKRPGLAAAAVLGKGKLRELGRLTGGTGVVPTGAKERTTKAGAHRKVEDEDDDGVELDEVDPGDAGEAADALAAPGRKATVVVVNHEITPSQARNLERATGAGVLDRTGVIVEIFHRHAKSREARLQVEIARLTYMAPRLRELGGGGDRQRGGIKAKGSGESDVELDRRKIRDRIAELREELERVQREAAERRAHRRDQRRVALVGYTNAGKSSLMRALTGSDVLVADKLFATLDTTIRALQPETRPRLLVSDTVGFIKKLPHDLIASFRSTLDEALEASLLLYVADASDPTFRSQLEVSRTVLAEIGAGDVPGKLLLNKADLLDDDARAALRAELPDATLLSALAPADVAALRAAIVAYFESTMTEADLVVPYARQGLLGEVHENARVLAETYDEAGAHLRVRAHPADLARLVTLLNR
jgi:GTP-binding protein HflX